MKLYKVVNVDRDYLLKPGFVVVKEKVENGLMTAHSLDEDMRVGVLFYKHKLDTVPDNVVELTEEEVARVQTTNVFKKYIRRREVTELTDKDKELYKTVAYYKELFSL